MSYNVSASNASGTAQLTDKPLVNTAVEAILNKKGRDITVLDMRHLAHAVAEFFIICSGKTDVQTEAIADDVLRLAREQHGERPLAKEGYNTGEWILIDYADVVVHIFQPRIREYYSLEEMWGDARILEVPSPD